MALAANGWHACDLWTGWSIPLDDGTGSYYCLKSGLRGCCASCGVVVTVN
jgi:hypothetical protein